LTSDGPGMPRLQIVTGAPGTGKTAIIERLGPAIHRMPEPARAVIADYRLIEGPDAGQPPVEVFVDLLLQRSIEHYETAQELQGLVVFDRGVPDCIAYAEWFGTDQGRAWRPRNAPRIRMRFSLCGRGKRSTPPTTSAR